MLRDLSPRETVGCRQLLPGPHMTLSLHICPIPLFDLPSLLLWGWQGGSVPVSGLSALMVLCLLQVRAGRAVSSPRGSWSAEQEQGWEGNTAPGNTTVKGDSSHEQHQISKLWRGKEKPTMPTGCKEMDFYHVLVFGVFFCLKKANSKG